jgi:hypothetical protein
MGIGADDFEQIGYTTVVSKATLSGELLPVHCVIQEVIENRLAFDTLVDPCDIAGDAQIIPCEKASSWTSVVTCSIAALCKFCDHEYLNRRRKGILVDR